MTLNIFTHPVTNETKDLALKSTLETFTGQFHTIRIWKDGHNTTGFADGYIQAVQQCEDDHIFMLEHDWEFIREPEHSLSEITDMMKAGGIVHLRFNKRENKPKLYDKWIKGKGCYCQTPFVSNNPHIIDRKAYLQFIENGWIQRLGKDKGVEEIISKHINGAIYGDLGYPAVVQHLNAQ